MPERNEQIPTAISVWEGNAQEQAAHVTALLQTFGTQEKERPHLNALAAYQLAEGQLSSAAYGGGNKETTPPFGHPSAEGNKNGSW